MFVDFIMLLCTSVLKYTSSTKKIHFRIFFSKEHINMCITKQSQWHAMVWKWLFIFYFFKMLLNQIIEYGIKCYSYFVPFWYIMNWISIIIAKKFANLNSVVSIPIKLITCIYLMQKHSLFNLNSLFCNRFNKCKLTDDDRRN